MVDAVDKNINRMLDNIDAAIVTEEEFKNRINGAKSKIRNMYFKAFIMIGVLIVVISFMVSMIVK